MTSFTMDEHGNIVKDPPTVEDLCAWAEAYHETYFSGPAPNVQIAIVEDTGGIACFDRSTNTAYIDRPIAKLRNSVALPYCMRWCTSTFSSKTAILMRITGRDSKRRLND
jgi:hypothetical protein